MSEKLYLLADKILNSTFYILFFTVPLVFFPKNYELFEFNKMMLTYGLAAVILTCWAIKCVLAGRLIFRRTLLFLPLLLFLLSQILSTVVSIDPHTSLWGYYTRANGGLFSTITYTALYWAFVSNMTPETAVRSVKYLLSSALIVSVWGILEHFGKSPSCLILTGSFDASCWVQDVQARVFATLGQPNWMAALLVAVTPLAWADQLMKTNLSKSKQIENNSRLFASIRVHSLLVKSVPLVLSILLFLALLFTKSRSGLLGLIVSSMIFWSGTAWINRKHIWTVLRPFIILYTLYSILILSFGSPWTPSIINIFNPAPDTRHPISETGTVLERGGTESGEIRKIVWKGAFDIWRAYPLFGSGVETFAYSYYNFRPVEHNLTSEWNFLYNKAHNEYLNFLATTGLVGLATYVVLIFFSIIQISNFKFLISNKIPNPNFRNSKHSLGQLGQLEIRSISIALLAGYIAILVTNFFGFSVVSVALLFFLYPAMTEVVTRHAEHVTGLVRFDVKRLALILAVLLITCYVLLRLAQFWYADTLFAQADKLIKFDEPKAAAEKLEKARGLNSNEPLYHDKLATAYSMFAALSAEDPQEAEAKGDAKKYADLAKQETDKAYAVSSRSIGILKSRASTFNRLTSVDPIYLTYAVLTLERAASLAPTDPVSNYNLGVALYHTGETERATETLEKVNRMKPDYADSRFALAEIYILENNKEKAKDELEYILKNIDPNNELAKKLLDGLSK